jgi:hypothetical protein
MLSPPPAEVISIESSTNTSSEVDPDMLDAGSVAVIVIPEAAIVDVARPAVLSKVTEASDELQVTVLVTSAVVLSEYVPIAVNCFVVLQGTMELAGVTAMDTSVASVAVSVAVPCVFVAVSVALMVVEPAFFTAVASPFEPPALLIVATDVSDEFQVTEVVRFCVVLSV